MRDLFPFDLLTFSLGAPPVGSSRELMDLLRNLLWLWVIIVTIFAWIVISLIFVFINKCISRAGRWNLGFLWHILLVFYFEITDPQ